MEPTSGARSIGRASAVLRRAAMAATVTAAVGAAALPAVAVPTAAGPSAPSRWRDVVVAGESSEGAARAVVAAGGQVIASLPVAHGVAARIPDDVVLPAPWVVAPQRDLRVATDPGSRLVGAATTVRRMLGLSPNGTEGGGVAVAVIDTGIADVPDLAGRVTERVDLTGSGAGDGYGHGTFMAGLIAGSGAASGGEYRGVAPAATLIDVKVADAEGRTDLITVLRGLQWVSEHARDIQVLNLSLSSSSPLPYQVDPLNQALRSLWHRGVTVVVPSGNDGPDTASVTAPGNDPLLLTAGGLEAKDTVDRRDDTVGTWSGRGPTWQGEAKPDLVAPGERVVSLRSPGSVIDVTVPEARVGADYVRGSGTSMATAVTSGVAAAVLAVQPKLRPDSVKNLFVETAYEAPALTRKAGAGAGGLDAVRALRAAPDWRASPSEERYARDIAALDRDGDRWAAVEKALLDGDRAAAAYAWKRLSTASRDWAARAWADLDPAARAWAARTWAARAWAGAGEEWAARAWAARAWAARAWASDQWAARAWAARAWAARAWASDQWAARAWASDQWAARAWAWLPPS